jgi:endonuclease YncB( thermonuclease family)
MTREYVYDAVVESVFDGDTLRVSIDLGFGVWLTNQRVDLYGIDAPEVILAEKYEGKLVKSILEEILEKHDYKVQIRSHVSETKKNYWAVELFVDGQNFNEELLAMGFASK